MLTYGGWPPSRHWGCRVTPIQARCDGNWSPQTPQFSSSYGNVDDLADGEVMGPTQQPGNDGLPNHPTHQRGAAVRVGMVENRSYEKNVEMLSLSSAGEVCGADAGRYNAVAVLPQGASDVQSIRAAQTADPRAKQTRPSGPARRSARVNSRPGDGDSPGLMPAGRFHLGEVVESFLGQPLLAGIPPFAAVLPRAWPPRTWAGAGSASTSRPRPSSWSTCACSTMGDLFHNRLVTARTDIPRRTDIDALVPYHHNKHVLFGQQEGRCNRCRSEFPFRVREVDHVIPQRASGQKHRESAAALRPLQAGEGRPTAGVSGGQVAGIGDRGLNDGTEQ